jgi:hypothetical protein
MATNQWVFFFFFFFSSIFSCHSKSDDRTQENLATSGYKKNKKSKNPITC